MSAPRSKLSAIFAGSVAGSLAVVILLMVPVIGVRKEFGLVALNWQEIVLYSACLIAGTIAGARVGFREFQSNTVMLDYAEEPTAEEPIVLEAEQDNEPEQISIDDDEPPSTVPQIELSLAGGPKKPRHRFWTEAGKSRTRVLLLFLYLLLYVMCSILCQKMNLGSLVTDALTAEVVRTFGLTMSVTGLYLMVRGMFVQVAPAKAKLIEITAPELTIGGWSPHLSPHVPPTRVEFLRTHPVCAGWLVLLTGLPIVFMAWFPLIAIPGLFIAMNWLFVVRNATSNDFPAATSA